MRVARGDQGLELRVAQPELGLQLRKELGEELLAARVDQGEVRPELVHPLVAHDRPVAIGEMLRVARAAEQPQREGDHDQVRGDRQREHSDDPAAATHVFRPPVWLRESFVRGAFGRITRSREMVTDRVVTRPRRASTR